MNRIFPLIICIFMISACSLVGSIKSGEADKYLTSTAENVDAYLSDADITATVKGKLLSDFRLKSRKISVTTTDAVVMMIGSVASEEERLLAISLAEGVKGVNAVKSQIQVRPER